MKLLLDEGMPLRLTANLRERGMSAEHVLERQMQGATDRSLLELARAEQAVVVAFDSDFHRLLAESGSHSPSVVRIRENWTLPELSQMLEQVVHAHEAVLREGALLSVTRRQVRMRRLPILP